MQASDEISLARAALEDGRRTTGVEPLEAARMAADRGVRVFTVRFGTAQGGSVAAAAALMLVSGALSLFWFSRVF